MGSSILYTDWLVEVASWHIVSELQHYNAGQFIINHSGPCKYNCLDLYDRERGHIAALNVKMGIRS